MHSRRIPPTLGTTFVDEESERAKAGLLLAALLGFLISGWYSFNELTYLVRGESQDATVIRMFEYTVPTRYGRSRPRLGIEYEFTDSAGVKRTAKDWVPIPSELRDRPSVRVQYLPGPGGRSRLEVNRSVLGPVVFLAFVAFVAVALFGLIREANRPIRTKRTRRRRSTRSRDA